VKYLQNELFPMCEPTATAFAIATYRRMIHAQKWTASSFVGIRSTRHRQIPEVTMKTDVVHADS